MMVEKQQVEQNVKNLKEIYQQNLDVDEESFDMTEFYIKTRCGTIGCLIGNAASKSEYLQNQGFMIEPDISFTNDEMEESYTVSLYAGGDRLYEKDAIMKFFKMSTEVMHYLFFEEASKSEALEKLKTYINNLIEKFELDEHYL